MKHKGINAQSELTIGEMQERRSTKKKKIGGGEGVGADIIGPCVWWRQTQTEEPTGGRVWGNECVWVWVCVRMQIDSPEGEHCSGVGEGGIRGRWELNWYTHLQTQEQRHIPAKKKKDRQDEGWAGTATALLA